MHRNSFADRDGPSWGVKGLDRSQSLFYFVPQEKRLRWRAPWAWKNMGDSIFHPENVNIWPETGQNWGWHMLRSSLVFSDFNFMHYWGQTPCKGLGAQTCKYVRANHSTAYFSSLKSALMCPLIWLADPKPPPISSRTYKCQASKSRLFNHVKELFYVHNISLFFNLLEGLEEIRPENNSKDILWRRIKLTSDNEVWRQLDSTLQYIFWQILSATFCKLLLIENVITSKSSYWDRDLGMGHGVLLML